VGQRSRVGAMGVNRAGSGQVGVRSGPVRSGDSGLVHQRAVPGRDRARPGAGHARACGPEWVAGLYQPRVGGRVKNQNQIEQVAGPCGICEVVREWLVVNLIQRGKKFRSEIRHIGNVLSHYAMRGTRTCEVSLESFFNFYTLTVVVYTWACGDIRDEHSAPYGYF
jgi:hypothetical protein